MQSETPANKREFFTAEAPCVPSFKTDPNRHYCFFNGVFFWSARGQQILEGWRLYVIHGLFGSRSLR